MVMDNTCIFCGEVIPEGRMVCWGCERGYSDVTQEFTGEDESTHLLYFAARIQEPDETIDDLARRVAGGKIVLDALPHELVGQYFTEV